MSPYMQKEHSRFRQFWFSKLDENMFVNCSVENFNHVFQVLSIIDSSYHIIKDMKETGLLGFKEKKKADQQQGAHADFCEVVTLHLPFIGVSLINWSPQVHSEL